MRVIQAIALVVSLVLPVFAPAQERGNAVPTANETIALYTASWCGPCHNLKNAIDRRYGTHLSAPGAHLRRHSLVMSLDGAPIRVPLVLMDIDVNSDGLRRTNEVPEYQMRRGAEILNHQTGAGIDDFEAFVLRHLTPIRR